MTKFYFYDDIADHFVVVPAESLENALNSLERDYGSFYMAHMHQATAEEYEDFYNWSLHMLVKKRKEEIKNGK